MKPKYPEDNKMVLIEFQDDWLRKSELLFAVRFHDKWIEMRSQRRLIENGRCRVLRWWSLDANKAYTLLPSASSNGLEPVCGYNVERFAVQRKDV